MSSVLAHAPQPMTVLRAHQQSDCLVFKATTHSVEDVRERDETDRDASQERITRTDAQRLEKLSCLLPTSQPLHSSTCPVTYKEWEDCPKRCSEQGVAGKDGCTDCRICYAQIVQDRIEQRDD